MTTGGSRSEGMSRRLRFVGDEGVDFVLVADITKLADRINSILTEDISLELNEIRKLQQQEFEYNDNYREGWEMAARKYGIRKKEIEAHYRKKHSKTYPEEYHIVLICYTMDHAMYGEFNKATREFRGRADLATYNFRSFFILLYKSILEMPGHPYHAADVLYRGVGVMAKVPAVGTKVAFQQFISTSRSISEAMKFLSGRNNTLFVIKGQTEYCTSLELHSEFPWEKECLIWPAEYYTVRGIQDTTMHGSKVRLITLEM